MLHYIHHIYEDDIIKSWYRLLQNLSKILCDFGHIVTFSSPSPSPNPTHAQTLTIAVGRQQI